MLIVRGPNRDRLLSLHTLGAKVKGLVKSRRLKCHMAAVQEAHGQRRSAKAPGTVPVCAPFRCDGAIDLSDRLKHDIDPIFVFIFFFLGVACTLTNTRLWHKNVMYLYISF
jgi:hypothetical protein